jgi:hypothetical protein
MSVITTEAARPSPPAARTRLLLEGPIVSTLLRLSAPNLVVNVVLITVTTSVDAHFIGRLGPAALAGLALVFPLLMLMQQMANFSMGGALAAAVARAVGAGRPVAEQVFDRDAQRGGDRVQGTDRRAALLRFDLRDQARRDPDVAREPAHADTAAAPLGAQPRTDRGDPGRRHDDQLLQPGVECRVPRT